MHWVHLLRASCRFDSYWGVPSPDVIDTFGLSLCISRYFPNGVNHDIRLKSLEEIKHNRCVNSFLMGWERRIHDATGLTGKAKTA